MMLMRTDPFRDIDRLAETQALLRETNMGATAIGTGITAPPGYAERVRVHLVEVTGLAGFEGAMPRELSGGMQQRASIVRALAQDPAVLLMDEPFGALDAFTRDEMNLLLLKLWSETGKTVVFVTHNIGEAIFLADRVVVMTSRPGRLARIYDIDLPRPRTIEMTFEPAFIGLIQEIKRTVEAGGPRTLEVE